MRHGDTQATRLASGESPRDMFFRYWGDAPFQLAAEQALSTFAVDVDTASYTLARKYLGPEELGQRMDNVVVQVVDEPRPDLFGLYEGIPLTNRGQYGIGMVCARIAEAIRSAGGLSNARRMPSMRVRR